VSCRAVAGTLLLLLQCRLLLFYIDNTSQQATENFTIVPPADKQAWIKSNNACSFAAAI